MLDFDCTSCGQHISAEETYAGLEVNCPTCGGSLVVPGGVQTSPIPTPRPAPASLPQAPAAPPPLPRAPSWPQQTSRPPPPTWMPPAPPPPPLPQAAKPKKKTLLVVASVVGAVTVILMGLGVVAFTRSDIYRQIIRPQPSVSEVKAAEQMKDELVSDMQKLVTNMRDENGMPKETTFRFDNQKAAANDTERIREMTQSFFNDMIVLQNDYLKALKEAGLDTLLDPTRISHDEAFRESYAILAKLRRVVHEYRDRANQLMEGFPQRIEAYPFKSDMKQSILKGYQGGLTKSMPLFREVWDIEISVVDCFGELIELLEASRSFWVPQDGKFTFQRDEDLQQFESIMKQINDGVARQAEIREKSIKNAAGELTPAKTDLPK